MAKLIEQPGVAELVEKTATKAVKDHNKSFFTAIKDHTAATIEGIAPEQVKFLKAHMKALMNHLKDTHG